MRKQPRPFGKINTIPKQQRRPAPATRLKLAPSSSVDTAIRRESMKSVEYLRGKHEVWKFLIETDADGYLGARYISCADILAAIPGQTMSAAKYQRVQGRVRPIISFDAGTSVIGSMRMGFTRDANFDVSDYTGPELYEAIQTFNAGNAGWNEEIPLAKVRVAMPWVNIRNPDSLKPLETRLPATAVGWETCYCGVFIAAMAKPAHEDCTVTIELEFDLTYTEPAPASASTVASMAAVSVSSSLDPLNEDILWQTYDPASPIATALGKPIAGAALPNQWIELSKSMREAIKSGTLDLIANTTGYFPSNTEPVNGQLALLQADGTVTTVPMSQTSTNTTYKGLGTIWSATTGLANAIGYGAYFNNIEAAVAPYAETVFSLARAALLDTEPMPRDHLRTLAVRAARRDGKSRQESKSESKEIDRTFASNPAALRPPSLQANQQAHFDESAVSAPPTPAAAAPTAKQAAAAARAPSANRPGSWTLLG